jgi:hypothetical protein
LRLATRAFKLQESIARGLTKAHHQEYETLAYLDFCTRQHANKKCRKIRMADIEFSDTIKIARGAIDLWDLLERKKNGICASTKKIRRLMKVTGEQTGFQKSLTLILRKLKEPMTVYKKLKKTANTKQVNFGRSLVKARAKERSTTVAAQERQLKNAFGQRRLAQQVKRLTGKQRGATL